MLFPVLSGQSSGGSTLLARLLGRGCECSFVLNVGLTSTLSWQRYYRWVKVCTIYGALPKECMRYRSFIGHYLSSIGRRSGIWWILFGRHLSRWAWASRWWWLESSWWEARGSSASPSTWMMLYMAELWVIGTFYVLSYDNESLAYHLRNLGGMTVHLRLLD